MNRIDDRASNAERVEVAMISHLVCASCSVKVLDRHDDEVAARAKALGIRSVPAVVIDGLVAVCCASRGVDASVLRAAGVGSPTQ